MNSYSFIHFLLAYENAIPFFPQSMEVLFTLEDAKAGHFESNPIISQESKISALNHGLLTHQAQ